jgi:hypothetical protein
MLDNMYVVNYNNQTLENLPDFIIETYGYKAANNPQEQVVLQGASLTSHQSTLSSAQSQEISDLGIETAEEDTQFAEQDINESLDFIHILSSRGLMLFLSESFRNDVLQYNSNDLVGRSLSDFCHPGDIGPLMKALKTAELGEKISTMYRFRTKFFGYVWLDVIGQKYEIPTSKRIKCFLLSGRLRQPNFLPHRTLIDNFVLLDQISDLWLKISYYGLILFVSSVCHWEPFGCANSTLFGTSIYDYILPKSIIDLKNAVSKATINCPILLSVTSKQGDQLSLYAHPCTSCIFLRIKSLNYDPNAPTVTPDIIYPPDALYVDTFLPILENSTLGYQFELNQLYAFNRKLKEAIQDVVLNQNDKKRKI